MNEEAINLIFDWAVGNGYKGTKEDWLNYIQTNDDAFNYVYDIAKRRGYQKDENSFGVLIGRKAPVATTEPAKTEPTKTEPTTTAATTTPAKTEHAKPTVTVAAETAPAKELSNKQLEAIKVRSIPQREVEMPVADETKMPPMMVREAAPIAEEESKKEMPIGENLLPVTEKTEVKAVETPSDKMVIKSEKKGKMKVAPEPIKIEPIKVETKGGQIQVEVPTFAIPEPKKKYKPYGEKGPDVYYSEDFDQYIIKEGDSKTIVDKGSPKYDEIDKKIGETVKGTIEGTGKCDPDESEDSCSKNTLILSDFINNNFGDDGEIGWRASSEGKLIHKLNEDKKRFDKEGESRYVTFSAMDLEDQNEKDPEIQAINKRNYEFNQKSGQIWYANDEPPKDKRFVIYKPYGDDRTLIYDKESEVILKQIDKAPEVDFSPARTIYDTKGNIVQQGVSRKELYENYKKNNPDKGLNVWYGYHKDRPEYKELKSIIEGIDYKKEKGGTTAPKVSTVPTLEPWQQPMQVKEVTEQPKVEVKDEEPKGIPSYDDLGINPEKDPGSFLDATTDKNVKFEKMSPAELIEKDIFFGRGSNVKLERNVSLRYPDPPGTVFKKEKVGEREVYSSYDKANDKWYIYDENSNKDNWTEVKAGPITTLLNAKFKENNKIIDSKTDYNSEEEENKISKMKEGILLNKYLPYVMKNYDNLSDGQKEKLKKDLNEGQYNMLLRKYLERNDPNLDFWLDINDKFFKNQSTYSNAIDVYGEENRDKYKEEEIEVPKINKDIEEGRLKLLKSVAGDVLYDEKNDMFYYGPSQRDLKITKRQLGGGDGTYREATNIAYVKIIPKGTPAYDKIKSSLSKYNK